MRDITAKVAKKNMIEKSSEVLAAYKRLKNVERRLQEAISRDGELNKSIKIYEILNEKFNKTP